jgi:hypothetical protein
MLVGLVLLLACLASAQTTDDARALLQEIASSSRDAQSWIAEGIRINELTGLGAPMRNEQRFKVAYQSPCRMLSDMQHPLTEEAALVLIASHGRFASIRCES